MFRDRDETRAELDRMRAAATTHESELARLRSEAMVSQHYESWSSGPIKSRTAGRHATTNTAPQLFSGIHEYVGW